MNLLALPAVASAAYHALTLVAAFFKSRERKPPTSFAPPVSILKPVRGSDGKFKQAIASHASQDYPEYEILFGFSDAADPAIAEAEQLASDYPDVSIRLICVDTDAPNIKVGVLEILAREARFPVLLVNDSDILVSRDYLRQVVAPLEDERTGLVTCLYRGSGESFPARSEALGVATEFGPSVLLARMMGVKEFAMGSTLAFRARDLQQIGGFSSFREYLADDYQLGKRLTALGLNVILGRPVVETWLGNGTWRDVWKHQVRWSRTIRVSRPGGYLGYAVTHAILWCALAGGTGSLCLALLCYGIRVLAAIYTAVIVMDDRSSLRLLWWLPARDVIAVAVWMAGWIGQTVEWRGVRLRLASDGRITPV